MNVEGQLHGQGKTAQGAVGVGGDAKARRIAGELVEHHHRPVFFRRQFGQPADIHLQVRAFDMQYLADLLRRGDKITHRFKCHVSSRNSKE